ncbi:MAG: tetratricopeptide repeat protein [Catenulispora sp.]
MAAASFAFAEGRLADAASGFAHALAQVREAAGRDEAATAIAARAEAGTGRVLLRKRNFPGADKAFTEALRLGADTRGDFFWAGCAAARCAEHSRAESLFTSAIGAYVAVSGGSGPSSTAVDSQPSLGRAYRHRAYARVRLGDYDEALADLQMVERLLEADDEVRIVAAWLLVRRRRAQEAKQYLRDVPLKRSGGVAVLMGYATYQQGRFREAVTEFRRAIAVGRPDADLMLVCGFAAYKAGDFDTSIAVWESARSRYPRDLRFYPLVKKARLGRVHRLSTDRDFEAAAAELRTIDRSHPACDALQLNAVFAAAARDTAGPVLQNQLLEVRLPKLPEVQRGLAALYAVQGRHEWAQGHWESLLVQDPDDRLARFGSALAAADRRQLDRALADLDRLTGPEPGPDSLRPRALGARVALHIRRGDWNSALDALAAAAGVGGMWTGEWDALHAEVLYRTGNLDELLALPDLDRRRPWKALALLQRGTPGRRPTAAEQASFDAALADERTRGQLARLIYPRLSAAVADNEWGTASSLLAGIGRLAVATAGPGAKIAEALVHVLGGDRDSAVAAIGEASRRNPLDNRVALVRALILLHGMSASTDWLSCIAAWAQLLHSEEFWSAWGERAEARYGEPVTPQMVETLRASLRSMLERRIRDAVHNGPEKTLIALWSREDSAAAKLAKHGGLPVPHWRDHGNLVCGPLRIGELGLHADFPMHLVSDVRTKLGGRTATEDTRYLFSQLGLASARLSAGFPLEVEGLAMDLRCPECRTAPGKPRPPDGGDPLLCRRNCPSFQRYNPGFSAHEPTAARQLLSRRASELSAQALMQVARTLVATSPVDAAELEGCWKRAVGHAARCGRKSSVCHDLATTALGRARVLASAEKWNDEVSVLDAALKALGDGANDDRDQVEKALGRSLENRSCSLYNGTYQASKPSLAKVEQAIADQRRSVALRPHIRRSTENLGIMLRFMQGMLSKRGERGMLRALLVEEEELYARALEFHKEEPDFEGRLSDVRARIIREFGG